LARRMGQFWNAGISQNKPSSIDGGTDLEL
jgi:hypothetical protein